MPKMSKVGGVVFWGDFTAIAFCGHSNFSLAFWLRGEGSRGKTIST